MPNRPTCVQQNVKIVPKETKDQKVTRTCNYQSTSKDGACKTRYSKATTPPSLYGHPLRRGRRKHAC